MESAGRGNFFFAVTPSEGRKGLFGKMAAVGQGRSSEKREKKPEKKKIEQKKREKIEESQKKKKENRKKKIEKQLEK